MYNYYIHMMQQNVVRYKTFSLSYIAGTGPIAVLQPL